MKAVVVLPTYNEALNLESLVKRVLTINDGLHVLIIDDSSPDGTGQIADEIARISSRVSVIHRQKKKASVRHM